MGAWQKMLMHMAWSGLLVSGLPVAVQPVAAQQAAAVQNGDPAANRNQQKPSSAANIEAEAKSGDLPDSPGVIISKSGDLQQQKQNKTGELWAASLSAPQSAPAEPKQSESSAVESAQIQSTPPQSAQTQSTTNQSQASPQQPVGTAAAEAPNASGIAASQPAGVAIAPAKQRRVRTIVLRTGAIIGAGVAVGTVVALTQATPSKPPGAH